MYSMVIAQNLKYKQKYRPKIILDNLPPELSTVSSGTISVECFLCAQRHAPTTGPPCNHRGNRPPLRPEFKACSTLLSSSHGNPVRHCGTPLQMSKARLKRLCSQVTWLAVPEQSCDCGPL